MSPKIVVLEGVSRRVSSSGPKPRSVQKPSREYPWKVQDTLGDTPETWGVGDISRRVLKSGPDGRKQEICLNLNPDYKSLVRSGAARIFAENAWKSQSIERRQTLEDANLGVHGWPHV